MKKINLLNLFFIGIVIFFAGCEAIGDIFKAGVWVGIIVVVVIVGLIALIVGKAKK